MKINEVEKIIGITKRNIRFYEKKGLLLPCRNSNNGYREYNDADLAQLKKIKLLRKLAVPIEEIHKIQAGILTINDALKRHLIILERDSKNIEITKLLCTKIAQSTQEMDSIDPDKYLEQIAQMEKEGVRFMNIKSKDQKKKMATSIIAALVFIAIMGTLFGLLLWSFLTDKDAPVILAAFLLACPAAMIIGVVLALKQRVKEIKEGEENAASQY